MVTGEGQTQSVAVSLLVLTPQENIIVHHFQYLFFLNFTPKRTHYIVIETFFSVEITGTLETSGPKDLTYYLIFVFQ